MARQYSARTFLRNTPNLLLRQYFDGRGIDLGFDWLNAHETDVNAIFLGLEGLPESTRSSVDGDFRLINDMACEAGVVALLEKAARPEDDWPERFAGMRNNYERVFWAFLTDPQRFRLAGCFHEMDRRAGWRRRFVGVHLEAARDDETLQSFEDALRLFYRRQGRGRFCHVDYYRRHGPERHCYFAYPEDYACTEIGYDDHGRFQHRARRAAFELIFVYRPEEGMLELCARGGKKQIAELQELFCTHILDLKQLPDDEGHVPFDLNVLKDRHFPFKTDPQDRIQSVHVRAVTFVLPGDRRRQLMVSADTGDDSPRALYDLLDEVLDRSGQALRLLHPAHARLRMLFAPQNGERPKSLTFEIKYPDRCSLKDDPYDQVCKKYLVEWGIARV